MITMGNRNYCLEYSMILLYRKLEISWNLSCTFLIYSVSTMSSQQNWPICQNEQWIDESQPKI